jgi:ATP synthase protein I
MSDDSDRLAETARKAAARERAHRADPEPSLGRRLGQIGALGWTVVAPILLALLLGRWLDRRLHAGVFYTAPLVMLAAGLGLWLAYRWMQRQ